MTVPVSVVSPYFAVMVAVHLPTPVTTPLLPTVATEVLLDVHVNVEDTSWPLVWVPFVNVRFTTVNFVVLPFTRLVLVGVIR